ncbi:hypothetical protein [Candidatus Symbiopectobacterium sp.]|uniref:hypothetical protein n=1 Tax=Candidatus Symbiopectobacterium sp. TaxID=2816440 RepID=UPI0025BFD07A|nr:hypothetical protein [Candidatus Symbiopectobacterium sp.]
MGKIFLENISKSLNTPVKRVGSIFFIVGCVFIAIGVAQKCIFNNWPVSFKYVLIESITFTKGYSGYSLIFGIGFYLAIAGLFLSYMIGLLARLSDGLKAVLSLH